MASFNVDNRTILIGDCLDHLRGINTESVDLVYLDPPFNKNRRFFAPTKKKKNSKDKKRLFDDVWHAAKFKDQIVKYLEGAGKENEELCDWLRSVKSIDPDPKERNYCYLVYMSVRLLECRRILKPTGSLFLHCDDTMSHWLKTTLDCIFDEENYLNEIIWRRTSSTHADAKNRTGRITDSIFWYSKSPEFIYKGFYQEVPKTAAEFPIVIDGKRYRDNGTVIGSPTRDQAERYFTWRDITPEHGWTVTEKKLEELYQKGQIHIKKAKGGGLTCRRIISADDYPGIRLGNLWTGLYLTKKEQGDYATQKPEELLKRIIRATTEDEDKDKGVGKAVVVDPFCGCATTCVAADNLGRSWVGIDIEPGAHEEIKRRLPNLVRDIECTQRVPIRTDKNRNSSESRYVYILKDDNDPDWHKVGIAKNWSARQNSFRTGRRRRDSVNIVFKRKTELFRELEQHLIDRFENDHEWVRASKTQIEEEINAFLAKADHGNSSI